MAQINVLLRATAKDKSVRKWFRDATKLADEFTAASDRAKASLSQLGQTGAGLGAFGGGVTGGAGGGRAQRGAGKRGGRGGVPTFDRALANAKRSTARAAQQESKLISKRIAMMAREGQVQARADRRRSRASTRAAKNIENLSDAQLREIEVQREINSRRRRAARASARQQLGPAPGAGRTGPQRFEMAENLATVAGEFEQVADRIQRGVESSADSFKDFQKGVTEVSTLTDQISIEQIEQITKGAAEQFGGLPTEQVSAFYQIVSAGATDAASAQAQLTAANKLAIGGVAAPEEAVLAISKSVANFGAAGVDATRAGDILFASVKRGQTTVSELARALPQAANAAATTGLRMEDLSASIAFLSTKLPNADAAAVGLAGAFANIQKPTKQARDEAKRLGIDFSVAGIEAAGGWEQFLLQLAAAEGFRADTIGKLFDSKQARKAIGTLIADMEGFNSTLTDTTKSAGDMEGAYGKMADTSAQKSERFKAEIELLKAQFGEALIPALEDLIDISKPVLGTIKVMIEDNPQLTKTVGLLALGVLGLSRGMSGLTTAMVLYNATAGISASRTAALGASQKAATASATGYGRAVGGANATMGLVPGVATAATVATLAFSVAIDSAQKPLDKFDKTLDKIAEKQGQIDFGVTAEEETALTELEQKQKSLKAELETTDSKRKQHELTQELLAVEKELADLRATAGKSEEEVARERLNRQVEIVNAAREAERQATGGGLRAQLRGGDVAGAFKGAAGVVLAEATGVDEELRAVREQTERDLQNLALELQRGGALSVAETQQFLVPEREAGGLSALQELIDATRQVANNTAPAMGPSMEAGLS